MKRNVIAELFGTFCLVFAGTGAIIVNDTNGGSVTHVGIAITFGLIVLAMIYTVGDVSGCHLNPAVTIGFTAAGRFPRQKMLAYILAQLAGGVAASSLLRLMFPAHITLGSTLPANSILQSWIMEFVLSLMLMVVILSVSTGGKEKGLLAGVAIGAVIALEAMFGGPISGASMNPARSIGPALVAVHFEHLWIYLTAPIVGAVVAVGVCRAMHGAGECCPMNGDAKKATELTSA